MTWPSKCALEYPEHLDDPAAPGYWHWWLKTRWLPHRNAVGDVHQLLARLQAAKGNAFMTSENVRKILDARDPEALAAGWGLEYDGQLGDHRCAWPGCRKNRVRFNGRWCGQHSKAAKRRADRESYRRSRDSGKVPSAALGNQGVAGRDPTQTSNSTEEGG